MITARTIKTKFAGGSFSVKDADTGADVEFTFPSEFDQWPRAGLEGLVVPVTCNHPSRGPIPSILKCFFQEIPERNKRQRYLVGKGLAGVHEWLYQGVPYTWINKQVNGERIYGHVAIHVCHDLDGDDFRIMKDFGQIDDFTIDERRQMAAQLCSAIVGLEKIGVTHGDLSPANIVMGKSPETGVRCVIIDYDGFNSSSASVPILPRTYNNTSTRPLGSPGYQHPSFIKRMKNDKDGTDDALVVENDRFALGALCFEIMTWTADTSEHLKRSHILDIKELERGSSGIPDAIKGIWPEGATLLDAAILTKDADALPKPVEWLRALGFLGEDWQNTNRDWTTFAALSIYKGRGPETRLQRQVEFTDTSGNAGELSVINPELCDVKYEYKCVDNRCEELILQFSWSHPVIIVRDGQTQNLNDSSEEITICPGDKVLSNGWTFKFEDMSITDSSA